MSQFIKIAANVYIATSKRWPAAVHSSSLRAPS